MVYGLLYLPLSEHRTLLADKHHFDDSKVLTPTVRSNLLRKLCEADSDLYQTCGWATRVMSARDIAAGMLKPGSMYNLNAQAMDATIDLIKDVFAQGVNIKEIYIDTIGKPEIYQRKLERIFPTTMITVAKKADSLYPCVSAASVCAKVTRDAALEVLYRPYGAEESSAQGWGSGYPSDARTVAWLEGNIDPLFGWGSETRFSWSNVKNMFEDQTKTFQVDWPDPDGEQTSRVTDYFTGRLDDKTETTDEIADWFGKSVPETLL